MKVERLMELLSTLPSDHQVYFGVPVDGGFETVAIPVRCAEETPVQYSKDRRVFVTMNPDEMNDAEMEAAKFVVVIY